MPNYDFWNINDHVEVYLHSQFILSADTIEEAIHDLEEENS